MPVRSRRLAAGTAPASALTAIYTVPADRVAIVKNVFLEIATGGAGVVTLSVGLNGGVGVIVYTTTGPVAGPVPQFWPEWVALNETDQLRISTAAGITVDYWVSGALLDGDPS